MEIKETTNFFTGKEKIVISLEEQDILKLLKIELQGDLNGIGRSLKGTIIISFSPKPFQFKWSNSRSLAKQKVIKWLKELENQKKTKELKLGGIFHEATGIYISGYEREWLKNLLKEIGLSCKSEVFFNPGQEKLIKLKKKVLKWLEDSENREKTKEMSVSGIFKAVIGRYPIKQEKKQIKEILDKKGIDYKKRGHNGVGLIDKVLKWLEDSENREKAKEMSISGICQEAGGRYSQTQEKAKLKKLFLEIGIEYKKRSSLKKEIDKKGIEERTKTQSVEEHYILEWLKNPENIIEAKQLTASQIWYVVLNKNPKFEEIKLIRKILNEKGIDYINRSSLEESLRVLEERREKEKPAQIFSKKDKRSQSIKVRIEINPTKIPKPEKSVGSVIQKVKVFKDKKALKLTKQVKKESFSIDNNETMGCVKIRRGPVDYWKVCRGSLCRGKEKKNERGKVISIICEIEVSVEN